MSLRSRTFRAVTDFGSEARLPKRHRRWRVTKKRIVRFWREKRLAHKWLKGMHNWTAVKVEAQRLQELFGVPAWAAPALELASTARVAGNEEAKR